MTILIQADYKKPLLWAVIAHLLLVILLCVSIAWQTTAKTYTEMPAIAATIISDAPLEKLKPLENKKAPVTQKPIEKPVEIKKPDVQKTVPVIEKKVVEKKITKPVPVKKIEKSVVKKIPVKKVVAEKPVTEKTKTEKTKIEKKSLPQKTTKIDDAKHQAEIAKANAARAAQMQGIVDRYRARILSAISDQWLIPASATPEMSCELSVQIAPNGTVLDVQLLRSSHHVALDRSAVAAVYKASPLPVPTDPEIFKPFHQLVITVRPETVIG